jgi:antitoxin VapB
MANDTTSHERHVRLFRDGGKQVVRIPREFEFDGDEAVMRKEGDRIIFEPVVPSSLLAVLATLEPIDEDFAPVSELPRDAIEF